MSAINLNDLTPEIVEKLLKIYEQGKGEEQPTVDRNATYVLPEEILQDLEESSKKELAQNMQRFQREVLRYEGGQWTKGGAINKVFIPDYKNTTLTAINLSSTNLQHLIERGGGDEDEILQIMEKARRLSVYGFASAKAIDNDAKTMATKALKLPENLIALGEDEEDEDKELAFSSEVVQRIQKARYDDKIIRGSQASASRSGGFANDGFRGPQNNRGRGSYSYNNRGGFYGGRGGTYRGRGKSFSSPTEPNSSPSTN
ncbi:hypothetical protein A0J61_11020 [Choanephora cucurbitarum]|uniref:Uncharacterized protein n=1 Tax=Choanephora cucurbitarum TaxID=101091 RepID=A0A1C7MVP6_9FUNG|nr:hypothetical protein A0J61_11020 [Choanephora cucurbitarum]